MSENPTLEADYISWHQRRFKTAVNRFNRMNPDPSQTELLGSLFAFHWLRYEVNPLYWKHIVKISRNPEHHYLTHILVQTETAKEFCHAYITHWQSQPKHKPQSQSVNQWLFQHNNQIDQAVQAILNSWNQLSLFKQPRSVAIRTLQMKQKTRYQEVGSEKDQQRLDLIDQQHDPNPNHTPRFLKLAVIPHMACPQSCRHCMFIWRPPMKNLPDPQPIFNLINGLTDSLLFTGGDLSHHLDFFIHSIRTLKSITTFAILLNGDFSTSMHHTHSIFQQLQQAIEERQRQGTTPNIIVQISFDEFHQEIQANRKGLLKERIPVNTIATILIAAIHYPQIQITLLHKQNRLNFSTNLFRYGVFSRLARVLEQRGHPVQILGWSHTPQPKQDPSNPSLSAPVINSAVFVLTTHPNRHLHLTSSTIDAYGRAKLLDASDYLMNTTPLKTLLQTPPAPNEGFDTDLMFWFDGSVTCFSATHLWLGNYYEVGNLVLTRHRKDPLLRALERFDNRLVNYYGEIRNDLETLLTKSTGQHMLFHQLTESADVRLFLTQRLLSG